MNAHARCDESARGLRPPSRRPRCGHDRALPVALLLCLSLLPAAVTPCPADVWPEFEKTIGQMALAEMKLRHGLVEDALLQQWVERIGRPVADQSRRHLRFSFTILDSYEDNAFSLPGGYICVTRGLLNHVMSDEELAGVLAHELAHAENRDFQRQLEEQLVFVGVQSLLRAHVSDEWVYATQILQVLELLRRQRRHEMQADAEGTNLAYAARYDPNGVVSFLQGIGPYSGLGGELLATHPKPSRRLEAVRQRIKELQADDYDGLIAVADSLRDRLHYARATAVYEQAARLAPDRTEARERLQDIRRRRGLPPDAAGSASDAPSGTASPEENLLALPESQRRQVEQSLAELRGRQKPLTEAQRRLHTALTRFYRDRQIAQALEVGQVIAPELDEPLYLATVARAYHVLAQAWKEAMRQGEILSRSGAIRSGWERSGADLRTTYKVCGAVVENGAELQAAAEQFAQAGPALSATTEAVSRSARVSSDLSAATRLLAAAFLALVGSGVNQPLGRINYTRFLILQGDVALAEGRIRRVADTGKQVHAEIVRRHLETLALQMSILHATARPELRELDRRLIAARCPGAAGATNHAGRRLLGEELLAQSLPADADSLALQALDSVLRMCYLDMRAERGE